MFLVDRKLIEKGLLSANFNLKENSTWYTTTPTSRTSSLPFFLIEWGHFLAESSYATTRKNDRFLLFYTISGMGQLTYSGKSYILEKDTICIIWCGNLHEYHTIGDETWDFRWIHFYGTSAQKYYQILGDSQPVIIHDEIDSPAERIIEEITNSNYPNNLAQNLTNALNLMQIMTYLCRKNSDGNSRLSAKNMEAIDRSIDYMEENLHLQLTVQSIAAEVFLSKYYFVHLFQKATGISPYQYLMSLRVNKAKELLTLTNYSLSDIADMTGFCDSKNLSGAFKKQMNMTPGQYRQNSAISK